jgi:response regulator RpfG family c-di-GMP phosphodiesterase
MLYILVVDDEIDITDIMEMTLKRYFPLPVLTARSGNEALKLIQQNGSPELVVSDYKMPDGDGVFLYQKLKELKITCPFIICSGNPIDELYAKFPSANCYIEKPKIIQPLVQAVDGLLTRYSTPPGYVPIRLSLLLRLGEVSFDLFMSLTDTKYVKVLQKGDTFVQSDAQRFFQKKIDYLYLEAEDASDFLGAFEKNLAMVMDSEKRSAPDTTICMEALETVERLASCLGWTPEIIEAAKRSLNLTINTVAANPSILNLLRKKISNPASKFSQHVSVLSLLACAIGQQLGWTSDSSQIKLGMTALMHDIALNEENYNNIAHWNEVASNAKVKDEDAIKYRNHPIEGATLLQSLKNLPPDIDQVILQHHEAADGSGFPRGLKASRISPLASLFIVAEDLVNYLDEGNLEERVRDFVLERAQKYHSGTFKKVFDVIKDSLRIKTA